MTAIDHLLAMQAEAHERLGPEYEISSVQRQWSSGDWWCVLFMQATGSGLCGHGASWSDALAHAARQLDEQRMTAY